MDLVKPTEADPRVSRFDEPNVVLGGAARDATVPLVVFLPGTNGRPQNLQDLLQVAADQGYRVIGLTYDDTPAVAQVCPRSPDPACSEDFRRDRIQGGDAGREPTPDAEAIVTRLVMLLRRLAVLHPDQNWNAYLDGAQPQWSKIVIGGFSQGAGMAAMLAKDHAVRRVVLFSGPWDTAGADRRPAPWLSGPSATAPRLWWAERHAQEETTGLLASAYAALGIPAKQILVFDHPLPPAASAHENPYHPSTVRRLDYAQQWRLLFGKESA